MMPSPGAIRGQPPPTRVFAGNRTMPGKAPVLATTTEVARARGHVGMAVLRGDKDAERDARRDLRAATLKAHIKRVVDEMPPFTKEQLDDLAAIIRGGAA